MFTIVLTKKDGLLAILSKQL